MRDKRTQLRRLKFTLEVNGKKSTYYLTRAQWDAIGRGEKPRPTK